MNTAKGRPPIKFDAKQYKEVMRKYKTGEITAAQAAKILCVSDRTFYRRLKKEKLGQTEYTSKHRLCTPTKAQTDRF